MNSQRFFRQFIYRNLIGFLLTLFLVTALGFFRMYGVTFLNKLMDQIESGIYEGVLYLIFLSCLMQCIFYFLRWVVALICQYLTQKCALSLRLELLKHLNKIPLPVFETLGGGNIQAILRDDVDIASGVIYAIFSRVLTNTFMALFSLGYLIFMDWKTGLVTLILSLGMGVINVKLSQPVREYQVEVQNAQGQISNHVTGVAPNFDTLKTYSATDFLLDLYRKPRKKYHDSAMKVINLSSHRENLITFMSNLSMFAGILFMSWGVASGKNSIGSLVVLTSLLTQVITPVSIIFRWVPSLVRSLASWQRVDQILLLPEAEPLGSVSKKDIEDIRLDNLSFSYPNRDPMKWDSLHFQRGKLYTITGESGSGKSTLLKLISGVYEADTGEMFLDHQPTESTALYGQIAYVPANPNLFSMSIYDNITMGEEIDRSMVMEQLELLGLSSWVETLPEGMDYQITENSTNLSGGQKQLLSIARGLVSQRPVLIMDEPFSAVDKEREKLLMQVLEEVKKDRIVIFTSHRESTFVMGDEIVAL